MVAVDRLKQPAAWLLAAGMIAVGVLHFVTPDNFARIVPDWLPWPLALVYISGAFEILGGLGLLHPRTRPAAAWGLVALYIAVFPANVHMAVNDMQFDSSLSLPSWVTWARLPLQAVFIAWAWWLTRPPARARPTLDPTVG